MKSEPLDPGGRVDPEVLAALLEGTLPAHERDEVLARLARSPDDYEAFVEAASVLRDLEEESGAAPVPPSPPPPAPGTPPPVREIRPARRRLPGPKLWLPLAAVLAGVMVVPGLLEDPASAAPLELLDGRTLVATPGDGSLASLGQEWNQPGWSVKRGGGRSLPEQHRDFRIGVRLAELDVALEAGDAQAVRRVEPELISLLSQVEASGLVLDEYRQISERASRQDPDGGEEERARAVANLAAFLQESPWFGLGIWLEQARLAALANQPRFFTASASDALEKLTSRVAEQQGKDAPIVQRLRSLRGLVDAVPRNGLGPVRSALPGIIRESGG
ncbi:MAG: hypothetical protein AB1941_13275 [Gemmatimonadota bacterium]